MTTAQTSSTSTRFPEQESILALAAAAQSDPTELDKLVVAFAVASEHGKALERKTERLERQLHLMELRIASLTNRMFGRSSEKLDKDQLRLFLEEQFPGGVPAEVEEAVAEDRAAASQVSKPKRKGHGRDSFPENLPRNDVRLDPAEDDCVCSECKDEMARIRDEITERGAYVAGYWLVNRYIRGVFACRKGHGGIAMAELPATLVDKGRFEPSVAVHAAVSKFADHLPLNRQEQMHARLGVPVSASTLGDQVFALAELHAPTVEQCRVEVMQSAVVHADDTPVKALVDRKSASADDELRSKVTSEEKRKKFEIEMRQWVYLSPEGKVYFHFTKTRAEEGPLAALVGFKGHLLTDGYSGFNAAVRKACLIRCGCWAHVRRKFVDALLEDKARSASVLRLINRLFWIERAMRDRQKRKPEFGDAGILRIRRRRSRKVLAAIRLQLRKLVREALPGGELGKAIGYARNQWRTLVAFVNAPQVAIHNNAAERALRTVAIGRKNYLFYGSVRGGTTAAVFYSLIGGCKALGLDPHAYLAETTARLIADPSTPRERLTPWAWARERGIRISVEAALDARGS